jgi:hypothetical protein
MGPMAKTNGAGTLNIGARLFRANGSDTWKLATLLTEQ